MSNYVKSGSETHFQTNKFHGEKALFERFSDEVYTALMNTVGDDGVTYLLTKWPQLADQEGSNKGKYDTGPRFTMMDVPMLLEGVDSIMEKDEFGATR